MDSVFSRFLLVELSSPCFLVNIFVQRREINCPPIAVLNNRVFKIIYKHLLNDARHCLIFSFCQGK